MIKHHFLSAMKLLVFCSVLIIYFASPTAALKCYECDDLQNDDRPVCKNPRVATCGSDMSQTYCANIWNDPRANYCNGNCSEKMCVPLKMEYSCDGYYNHVIHQGNLVELFCCQGDLCNGSDKLSNQMNVFLCAVVFSCFHGLVVYLWN